MNLQKIDMRLKGWAGILLLIALTVLAGCRKADSKLHIAVAQCSYDDWRLKMNSEMRTVAATRHDVELHFRHAGDNSRLQVAQIDSFIREKPNLLIVAPNEADTVSCAVERAQKAGIPVVVVDRMVSCPHFTAYVGCDNVKIGHDAARFFAARHPEGGVVWQVTGLAGSTPAADRARGFLDELAHFSQFTLLPAADGEWNAHKAAAAARRLLAQGMKPDFIFVHNDPMAAAVQQVMAEHGLHPAIVGVDALDGTGLGLDLVEQGKLEATMYYPTAGDRVMDLALDILDGKPYRRMVETGTALVTKDNVGIFRRQAREMMEREERINRLAWQLDSTLGEYRAQRLLLFVVCGAILLVLALFGMALRAYWQKRKWNEQLAAQNKLLQQQRDELVRMSRQVEEATQSKINFFTHVSHDFRTPLTLIAGPLEQLQTMVPAQSTQHGLVQTARRNVAVMLRLVGQILDIRRIESGQMPLHLSRVKVNCKVEEWVRNFQPMAAARHIHLLTDTEKSEVPEEGIWMDEEKVERICFNLLGNAFKFTPEGGEISVKVAFDRQEDGGVLRVVVSDTGCGMTEEEAHHVFERFYQSDHTGGGSGIGLTVARCFAQMHGGDIEVESRGKGKGAAFVVTLKPQPAPDDGQEQTAGSGALHIDPVEVMPANSCDEMGHFCADNATECPDKAGDKRNADTALPLVLVIDDNDDIRSYLSGMLSGDFRILTAADGAEGLRLARDRQPDLIVCDMMMPVMDGMACLKAIREEEEIACTPVVMLTACALDEERIAGYEGGADAYIAKPFSPAVLRARLLAICENRRRLRALLAQGAGLPETLVVPRTDKDFATRLRELIEHHLADTEYGVEEMAHDMAYSRTQLYRKVKTLTGLTPLDILRKARLHRAKECLSHGMSPSEVAYATGFASPSYFSKCYRAEFGCAPSEEAG